MATATFEDRVRARMAQLRFERGVSLRTLAASTGISASTLSRIEAGQRRLSLDQLEVIAAGLEVELGQLVGAEASLRPRARDGRRWESVGPERAEGRRVYRIEIAASDEPHLHSHEGHQWVYVLDGRLRLVVEDDERILGVGDAAEFDTWRPHWLGGIEGPVEALAIFSPLGEPLRPAAVGSRRSP